MSSERSRGDPEGRRLARQRATLLAEAGSVARALSVLLKRANFPADSCDGLVKELARQEAIELSRSYGRVESRRRFKHNSPQPLQENRPTSFLFIDECGKSGRDAPHGPHFFALGAVAMDGETVQQYRNAADELKQEFFGTTDMTFHEPLMRAHNGPYYFNGDTRRQQEFDESLQQLLKNTEFAAFGVGIRKSAFQKEFVESGIDPYLPTDVYTVAIILLLERYIDFLNTRPNQQMGRVTFESIGPKEDAFHQLEYARILMDGSQWVPDRTFRNSLETGLQFRPKRGSDPLELADIFSRDLFEWIRGGCTSSPKWWDMFSEKIYCRGDGLMGKFGVKVFPDSDMRDLIVAHRRQCGAIPS